MSEQTDTPKKSDSRLVIVLAIIGLCLIIIAVMLGSGKSRSDNYRPAGTTAPETYTVVYELTGISSASLTLENDTNGTEQSDFRLPYKKTWYKFVYGDFVYISAQALIGGNLTCTISVNGKVIATATSNGKYQIASCSARVGD
jgi:hypothetical protein